VLRTVSGRPMSFPQSVSQPDQRPESVGPFQVLLLITCFSLLFKLGDLLVPFSSVLAALPHLSEVHLDSFTRPPWSCVMRPLLLYTLSFVHGACCVVSAEQLGIVTRLFLVSHD